MTLSPYLIIAAAAVSLAAPGCARRRVPAQPVSGPVPPPAVLNVTPASGPNSGGTTITLTGTGFRSGATVLLGTAACTTVTVVSSAQITCTTPSVAPLVGPLTLTVTNPDTQSGTLSAAFNALGPAPTIVGVSPAGGPNGGGTTITITGTNFFAGATVTIGGAAAGSVSVVSPNTITCVTPNLAPAIGPQAVVVTNLDGNAATQAGGFNALGPAPTLGNVSPASGPVGGGTTITLTGGNFFAGATVTLGGVACTSVTLVSGTSITCVTPPMGTAIGPQPVTVTNLDGQSATWAGTFNVLGPLPTLTGVAPGSGSSGGGTLVTLTGTNFFGGATVLFGTAAAGTVTVVSATSITCFTPAGTGTVGVTVTNVDGRSATLGSAYAYVSGPSITGLSPSSGTNAGGTAITITGTNFFATATVTIGGNAAGSVNVVNSTTITATTPAAAAGVVGPVTVTVTNPGPLPTSLPGGFTYIGPAPTLTGVSPASGPNSGGTTITLTGSNYFAGATVTLGGVACTTVTVVSSGSITCTTPSVAPALGPLPVVVTNLDGNSVTLPNAFNALAPAPTLLGVNPGAGPYTGGTTITLTGTNFFTGITVTVGGTLCTAVNVTSASSLTCVTPSVAPTIGPLPVVVTNLDGNSASLPAGFNALGPAPTATLVSPTFGPNTGGTTITITGTSFFTGATVTAAGVACGSPTVVNGTTITCVTPNVAPTTGAQSLVVTNLDGQQATLPGAFTFIGAAPTLTGVAPSSGPQTGGITITLTGTNFVGPASVTVGGTAATGVIVVSPTSITATLPPGAGPGAVTVTVTTTFGTASLTTGFTYLAEQTQEVTSAADWAGYQPSGVDLSTAPGDVRLAPLPAGFASNGTVVTAIAYDHSQSTPQRILVGTNNAGAFLTTDGGSAWTAFHRYSTPALPSNRVLSAAFFSGGNGGQTFAIGTAAGAALTTDGGATFRVYTTTSVPALPGAQVESIAFFDGNTTGDRFVLATNAGAPGGPGGAVHTTDGGRTLRVFNGTSSPALNAYPRTVAYYSGDTTGNRFLVGCYASNVQADGGMYLTTDGGQTFASFRVGNTPTLPGDGVRSVAFLHGDSTGGTWLAALDTGAGGAGGVVLTTDGGNNWTKWNTGSNPALPSNDAVRAAFSSTGSRFALGFAAAGLLFTTDGGTNFTPRTTGSSPALADDAVAGLDWHRGSTTTFGVATGTFGAAAVTGAAEQTTDTGGNFNALSLPAPAQLPHPDVRDVAVFDGDGTGNRLLVATPQGALLSTDGGATWTPFTTTSTPPLPSNDVRSVAWYEGNTTGTRFAIGTAAGVVATSDGGSNFTTLTTAQGLPSNDVRAVAYHSGNATLNGALLVGTPAGVAFTANAFAATPVFTVRSTSTSPALPNDAVAGVSFYDGDANGDTWLVATAGGLVKTTDGGQAPGQWTVWTTGSSPPVPSNTVTSCAWFQGAASDTTFLAGTAAGAVRTVNGGGAFTTYTTTQGLPDNAVAEVAWYDGNTTGTAFAIATNGAGAGGLALTTNGGTSFTLRTAGSPLPSPGTGVVAVDYDDGQATADHLVFGAPATVAIEPGGVVIERGPRFGALGTLVVGSLEGGVIPIAPPTGPTWDDRLVRAAAFHDGTATPVRLLVGGVHGAAWSTNGGTLFTPLTTTTTPALASSHVRATAFFAGDTTGATALLATAAGCYLTTDGGSTFTLFTTAQGLPSNDVRAVAWNAGAAGATHFALATPQGIAYTVNGGSTFTVRNAGSSPAIADDCRAIDYWDGSASGARFAVATGSGVYHTEDGGGSFNNRVPTGSANSLPSLDVRAIAYFSGDATGATWIVGAMPSAGRPGGIGVTANNGQQFTRFNTGTTPALPTNAVFAIDYFQGSTVAGTWIAATGQGLTRTTDNGATFSHWGTAAGLPSTPVTAVRFFHGQTAPSAWLAATDGGVVRTIDGGTTYTAFRRGTVSGYVLANVAASVPAGTSLTFQVLDGSGMLIPDAVLAGNSAGLAPDGLGNIDLSAVSITTYPAIQLRARLASVSGTATPVLQHVRIRFRY